MPVPEWLLGPAAALIGAVVTVVVLWREHQEADRDDRRQRDVAQTNLAAALDGIKRLADAWEARNLADENRRRRSDPT